MKSHKIKEFLNYFVKDDKFGFKFKALKEVSEYCELFGDGFPYYETLISIGVKAAALGKEVWIVENVLGETYDVSKLIFLGSEEEVCKKIFERFKELQESFFKTELSSQA